MDFYMYPFVHKHTILIVTIYAATYVPMYDKWLANCQFSLWTFSLPIKPKTTKILLIKRNNQSIRQNFSLWSCNNNVWSLLLYSYVDWESYSYPLRLMIRQFYWTVSSLRHTLEGVMFTWTTSLQLGSSWASQHQCIPYSGLF